MSDISGGPVGQGELYRAIESPAKGILLTKLIDRVYDPELFIQLAAHAEPASVLDCKLCLRAHKVFQFSSLEQWEDLRDRARVGSIIKFCASVRCFQLKAPSLFRKIRS